MTKANPTNPDAIAAPRCDICPARQRCIDRMLDDPGDKQDWLHTEVVGLCKTPPPTQTESDAIIEALARTNVTSDAETCCMHCKRDRTDPLNYSHAGDCLIVRARKYLYNKDTLE